MHWADTPLAAAARPAPGEVQIWRIGLEGEDAVADAALLSPAERERVRRHADAAEGHRRARARALLRRLLGQCLGADPAGLRLEEGPHGKPFLAGQAGPEEERLHFNLSHAGGIALIALAVGTPVGVDLESMGRRAHAGAILERWFSAGEQAAWEAEGRHPAVFFRLWTRKEAVLKAHGGGLAAGMATFSTAAPLLLTGAGAGAGAGAIWPPAIRWEGTPYALLDLAVGDGLCAAVAVAGRASLRGVRLSTLAEASA